MATSEAGPDHILRPIENTSRWWYVAVGACIAVTMVWLAGWGYQLQEGLIVTSLGDWGSGGGVTWGLYIGAFIWWVGIAHGGIILSAAVRLFGMDRYQPVARMAELLTIAALSMAGLYIVVHTGRPDRLVLSILPAYPTTVQSSPLVWDVTVITLYFVLTATYLALTLRYDIARLRHRLPSILGPVYKIMLLGYSEEEDEIIERMVWWLALGIIVLAPLLLHGGVIPWLFSLLPSMPGWQGAVQGPQFLTIALTSAISGVIILSYAMRWAYDWEAVLPDEVFRGLTMWLGLFSLLFIWLQLQQVINGVFAAPADLQKFAYAKLSNEVFILVVIVMTIVLAYIFAQAVNERVFTKNRSLAVSFLVLYATLSEKILFVVEGLQYPTFDLYSGVPGVYVPSLVEGLSLAATIAMCSLIFLVIVKVIPVVELHAVEGHDDHGNGHGDASDEEVTA
ncbi:NrfD/PsrC family molybdoenzyme membrane anchor subunit [Halovenus marina]|uniref:NrfD/PsrC family molybdoenzyme membrane anchor subunit n=1 Tax=Halovenus marina TaxID=3396621 RepID=UPI003F57D97E